MPENADSPVSVPDARPPVHVVAGVIRDPRGRILLARRTAGRDLAGSWEFPGGKVDAGETPEQALARELHEELGIDVRVGKPLIRVPHAYPHKRIVLDVREIESWSGTPTGREHQALTWASVEKLSAFPMPPADRPVVAALTEPSHYLITPEPDPGHLQCFLRRLEQAVAGGILRIQLRSHALADDALFALASAARERLRHHGVELLLNCGTEGHLRIASALRIGMHLRACLLMQLGQRPADAALRLAASCHDADELAKAQALGLDFVVLGPLNLTTSHPDQPGIGWQSFASMRERMTLPIYALGGLGRADLAQAREHGAQGIAAIRAFWPSH